MDETIGNRIKRLRRAMGLNQTEFGKLANVTKGAVSQWENDITQPQRDAIEALRASGIDARTWTDGTLDIVADYTIEPATPALSIGPDLSGKIPIIGWVHAGEWTHTTPANPQDESVEWIDVPYKNPTGVYCLRIENDSMEPEFPPGHLIVVDPNLVAESGDYVIARNGDDEVIFKQLIRDGGDWYLKPTNPRYPIKPLGHAHIIGVVTMGFRRYRR